MYSRSLSRPGSNGCCGFFGLLGCVLKVVFPNVSPVSVAGIFRGQQTRAQILQAFGLNLVQGDGCMVSAIVAKQ